MILKNVIDLYDRYKEVINYLIFGFLTFVISLLSYYLFTVTILDASNAIELQISNILSWIISVIFAYVTNRKFVFVSKNDNIVKEISSFFGARVITLIMDMLIMFIFVTLIGWNDKVFKIISQIVVIVSNYFFSKFFVFK